MKKFFKGLGKKSQPKGTSPGPSPALSRRGGATAAVIGYDVKEKELAKLHKAAWTGDVAKVKQLAKKDSSPFDKENRTPLHLACVAGHIEVVKELLEWKAKTNLGDNEGKTPLMKAVECQREDCVRLLIRDARSTIDNKDVRGDTALHLAVREGNITITELLIKEGATVNETNKASCTPLHLAVSGKREQIAHILLQHGTDVDCIDSSERTPLMLACQDGNVSMVRLLLKNNADTELKDIKGWSADDIAVMQAQHSCSHLITDHNVQLKRPPSASSTPRSNVSLFGGSAQNTPRQESTSVPFGAPVGDMAEEDSGDETVSKASGGVGGGYDSWNSDTDLSLATDDKKRSGPKLNLSKMVNNMSESDDLDTPREGAIPEEEEMAIERPKAKVESQDSLRSQQSLPDQWSDPESPLAPKRSATRVSFKRDEELSQVHNISAQEEESSDLEPQQRLLNNGQPEKQGVGGYTASASISPSKQTPEMSQEKMRALMEELGISDVDDITDGDISEEVSLAEGNRDNDDGAENGPRPGILKNWKQSLEDVGDDSQGNGQDDNSEWDSDVEGLLSPRLTHMSMAKQEESDWDSTVDAVTPRNQSGGQYQQLEEEEDAVDQGMAHNVGVSMENTELNLEPIAPAQSTPVKTGPSPMAPRPGEEEDESAWDSEDELSQRGEAHVAGRPSLSIQKNMDIEEEFESEEEDESISEWELERQRQKELQHAEEEARENERQRQMQEEIERKKEMEEAEQQRELQEEAERRRRMQEEADRQMQEAERQRQLQEEAEQQRRQQEEVERLRQVAEKQRQIQEEADRQRQMEEEAERQRIWEEEQKKRETAIAREAELELQREIELQTYQTSDGDIFDLGSPEANENAERSKRGEGDASVNREELNNIHREAISEINHQGLGLNPTDNDGLVRMSLQSDGNSYDEEDSMMSDNFLDSPRDARNQSGLLSPGNLYANLGIAPDDDGLSYTSTEDFGGELQTVPYGRDILSGMTFGDSSTAIKLQENIRDQKRQLEREKSQRMLMDNKHRILLKENDDLQRKVEDLSQQRSSLEQVKLDLEAKNRSLAYNLNEETEKRKNADVLLLKIREQLDRKEEQYTSEMEAKQKAELAMRNIQMELRSAQSTIKQLTDEKQDLERHLTQEKSARALQEQLNEEQQRRNRQLQQDSSRTVSQTDFEGSEALNKLEASDEGRKHAQDTVEKLRAEVYALKMELDRQRARFKDDHTVLSNENEELQSRIDDLKNDLKLNEEALAHATMQYNVQLSSMRTENSMLTSSLEKERATKDKVETELESMRNRQHTASLELERSQQARNEADRMHQREKDDFSKQMDRREQELSNAKDNLQAMHQRATTAEAKLSSVENELHMTNSSLLEKNTLSSQLQREVEHAKSQIDNLDENFKKEKEQVTKLQVKLESAQDRVNSLQHENLTVKQQLETAQHSLNDRTGMDINDKFNAMLSSIKLDHDKSRSALEDKNSSMSEMMNRLKEELRNSDNKRINMEQELRRLNQDHNDAVKRLTSTEASLEVTQRMKVQLEQERNQLRLDIEKATQKYEIAHDKTLELQARITELVDRLERAEHSSILSTQQLAHNSADIQAFSKSRDEMEDSVHKLQVEKVKLETELKHEKQRVELLQRDLEDSQKVRSSLEALCSNLKTTNAHLEDKLGEETVTRTVLHQEAEDTKDMWEREVLSRSKLGLRIAQLDRQKQDVLTQLEEEKRKVRKALEAKRLVETKLEAEVDKNAQLQKEIAHLKAYLKSAKKKLRLNNIDDLSELQNLLQDELDQKEQMQSKNRTLESLLASSKATKLDKNRHLMDDDYLSHRYPLENGLSDNFDAEHLKKELEAKYRMELNRKLEDVNRYLEEQAQARDRLDHVRNNNESSLKAEKRKLEDEISELRLNYEQAVAERQSKDLEARRFRDLYDGEMKWRMKLGDQLHRSSEKSYGYKSRLATEMHRNRIYGSVGNLSSPLTVVDNSPFDTTKVSNRLDTDDPLNRRLKAELDRSIAKHLEAGPHDNLKPVIRTAEENPLLSSSLAKSNSEYLALLKKKYFV